MTRSSEENGNRIAVMEADLARLRADQDGRLRALETAAPAPARRGGRPPATRPRLRATSRRRRSPMVEGSTPDPAGDPVLEQRRRRRGGL